MRVQEHLFQGFFGINKKEDSIKHYHEQLGKLRGIDENLDHAIEEFQKILANHAVKLRAYTTFLEKWDSSSWNALREELRKLEGMFDPDEISNETEKKYVLKVEDKLHELTKSEDSAELGQIEHDTLSDLRELARLLESIKPLWERQLEFIQFNDELILSDKQHIRILNDILKEESDILRMEENLLRKIDLKTGTVMRKTTLRMRDIDKTKDMGMDYREIRHIR